MFTILVIGQPQLLFHFFERNALGFNCRDTVSTAALKLFGKNTRGARDQIRIIKDIGSVKEVAAEQTGRIDQPPRKFRLQRFDLFLRNVRNRIRSPRSPDWRIGYLR